MPTNGAVILHADLDEAFAVQGGMPGTRAALLCPELVFVRGHFGEYRRLAKEVMAVLADITPRIERISIDEAFLDVSGATHLFGPPAVRTKHLAKITSQVAKPDWLVVPPGCEGDFLDRCRSVSSGASVR